MSHNHCHNDTCSEHSHHHDHKDSCCHGHHHHHEHHEDDFAQQLLNLADEAWMEVLKEKIKEQIHEHNGKHLDSLARLVAESNSHRWKNKLNLKHACSSFKEKLHHFFNH